MTFLNEAPIFAVVFIGWEMGEGYMTDSEGEGSPGKTSIFVRESNGSMRGDRSLWMVE